MSQSSSPSAGRRPFAPLRRAPPSVPRQDRRHALRRRGGGGGASRSGWNGTRDLLSPPRFQLPCGMFPRVTESCLSPPVRADLAVRWRVGVGGPQGLAECQDGPAARPVLAAGRRRSGQWHRGALPGRDLSGTRTGKPGSSDPWPPERPRFTLPPWFRPVSGSTAAPETPRPSAAGFVSPQPPRRAVRVSAAACGSPSPVQRSPSSVGTWVLPG